VPLYKCLAKFPEVGDSIIVRFENSAKNIPESTVPKYNFQKFQLVAEDSLLPMAVDNNDTKICMYNATWREIEAADNIFTVDAINRITGYWADDQNTAAASFKFSPMVELSDISTHFVVSKDMVSGQTGNVSLSFVIFTNVASRHFIPGLPFST
jgi:hypothetical protein